MLAVSALFAGTALVSPICYWQGRQYGPILGGETPAAWDPNAAPAYWLLLALAIGWIVLWFLFARAQRRARHGWLLTAACLSIFLLSAWRGSMISYACSPF